MDSIAARNQAIYQERMKRRLEEHQAALQDWRTNLRIVPMQHRQPCVLGKGADSERAS